jgi:hypothetical protein
MAGLSPTQANEASLWLVIFLAALLAISLAAVIASPPRPPGPPAEDAGAEPDLPEPASVRFPLSMVMLRSCIRISKSYAAGGTRSAAAFARVTAAEKAAIAWAGVSGRRRLGRGVGRGAADGGGGATGSPASLLRLQAPGDAAVEAA